jgi:hypothetical protein
METKRTWGEWAFLVGVILAIVLAFFPEALAAGTAATILIILGFIVGFWNVGAKEKSLFLIAAVALLAVGAGGLQNIAVVGEALGNFTDNITAFVAPVAFIVTLKAIIEVGQQSA